MHFNNDLQTTQNGENCKFSILNAPEVKLVYYRYPATAWSLSCGAEYQAAGGSRAAAGPSRAAGSPRQMLPLCTTVHCSYDFTCIVEVPECFYVELEQFVSPALAQADCQGLNKPWNRNTIKFYLDV